MLIYSWDIFIGRSIKQDENKYKYWYTKISFEIYLLNYKQFKFTLNKMSVSILPHLTQT